MSSMFEKYRLRLFALLWILLATFAAAAQPKPISDLRPTVILISLDGFRYDYLQKNRPPHLNELARSGVRARWMVPSFPSKTFPNHYTIATGLYPEHHGIVENNIYDPQFNGVFTLSNREEVEKSRWWLGEPIWVTAEKQGQRAASFFYPGTEGEIAGVRPTFWKHYDPKITNDERVDTVLSWLDLPVNERPTLLALYFSDTDDAGHAYGPTSAKTRQAVLDLDREIGRLIDGLRARGVFDQTNLIIVSDHGMAAVDWHHAILLDEIFDPALAERIFWTREIVSIFPKPGTENEIYQKLKLNLPHRARVYRKAEMPARFHYSHSSRIAPLLVLPDEGWILTNREAFAEMQTKGESNPKGGHGYDNRLKSMRAIFIGHGPALRQRAVVAPFENVQIYNVMAKILGLRPAPNDGTNAVARRVLRR